jgi:hypothetical protein
MNTTECPLIRHGRYTSTMCGAPLTEDVTRRLPDNRRHFYCEEGHSHVAVRHCNLWQLIVDDAESCERCDQLFNRSGQELLPRDQWEPDNPYDFDDF